MTDIATAAPCCATVPVANPPINTVSHSLAWGVSIGHCFNIANRSQPTKPPKTSSHLARRTLDARSRRLYPNTSPLAGSTANAMQYSTSEFLLQTQMARIAERSASNLRPMPTRRWKYVCMLIRLSDKMLVPMVSVHLPHCDWSTLIDRKNLCSLSNVSSICHEK
jgi:hypothetical protein